VKVGSLDVTILVDGEGSFATIAEAFPGLSSRQEWRLPVHAVLIRGAGPTLLVDTGLGPEPRVFMPGAGARLLAELARAGASPTDVDLVVHTHLHVDHVGWDGSFPNARYVVSAAEWSYFMSEDSLAQRPHLRDRVAPLRDAGSVDLVDGEREIASGVRLVPTRPATRRATRVSSSSPKVKNWSCSATPRCMNCSWRIRISPTSTSTIPSCRRRLGNKSSGSSPTGAPP
jgi:glyoxylase-like metal-dependent hydrolase (beta-lactamase superfamily II)